MYEVHNIHVVRCLRKLCLRFSPLNKHKFQHNFDCLSPICMCNTGIEYNEHFLNHTADVGKYDIALFSTSNVDSVLI